MNHAIITNATRIGIWGFGRVGKATALFLAKQGQKITVMDKRVLTEEEQTLLKSHSITFISQDNPATFFEQNDLVLASPGIDLVPWQAYRSKMVTELDLFAQLFKGSLIAITGTVGKTTSTTLLSQLLTAAGKAPLTGGNIGIPTFSLLADRPDAKLSLLEVSSFQLELCKNFAPDLAIWTNFFSNHLDRHANLHDYFQAKKQLLNHQHPGQHALLNADLITAYPELLEIPATIHLFTGKNPADLDLPKLSDTSSLFFIKDRTAYVKRGNTTQQLFSLDDTRVVTFPENLLVVGAALHLFGLNSADLFKAHNTELSVPEHRLEPCARCGSSVFYNDSKATTPQATMAAVQQLAPKPIKLFLGGLGKGIDREPMIKELATTTVRHIYCFGKEAEHLANLCATYGIAHSAHTTLAPALTECIETLQPNEQVLFSPSGSSFDLFKDFEDRGRIFKQLTKDILATDSSCSERQSD